MNYELFSLSLYVVKIEVIELFFNYSLNVYVYKYNTCYFKFKYI